ncbi:thyroid transcription factor 1-associated protein 26 homolog [Astyanax mexicanus]|uniref:Coiled-coil domain containing 59 n=1 Tax=Astyanax mexicanus TaxID=7994 RepID=A0A8B9RG63_ASTMX|nr:thyroid transcription factor 1-associated protein 26 homolog [Astyanax mexicanus]KAG9280270.1 thyroid transcription factor 1-associated protein 26 [Astyanax mexicanus]
MAQNFKGKNPFQGKNLKKDYSKGPRAAGVTKKRKWVPANKFYSGSVKEGQGFAFNRKQKTQRQYNKLLRKEKWRMKDFKPQLTDNYPEHLKHLYMAEQERMEEEEQVNRNRRRKVKAANTDEDEEEDMTQASVQSPDSVEKSASADSSNEPPQSSQSESSHKDSQRYTKKKKMSSYQKAKQEYETLKEERERKREEYLKDKEQREEALKKYKEKKQEKYQLLKKKTKKGQPNLNLQMELLLQKIQSQRK